MAMAPVGFGVALGWAALLASVGVEPVKQDVVQIMLSPETAMGVKIYFVGLAVVVAPVSEELVFRGVLLPAALRWTRPWFAVALVSGAFAAIHLHIDSFPMLFLLSAGLCVAHISSGRLSVCMAMHAMFNATSIAVMFLAEWLLKSMPG